MSDGAQNGGVCKGGTSVPYFSATTSATLNVLLDDHTAMPEEWAWHALLQCPGVGAGVKGLHIAQRRTLTAYDASCSVDLPIQNHGTAQSKENTVMYERRGNAAGSS